MKPTTALLIAAACCTASAGFAQDTPQSHLLKAKTESIQNDGWVDPALLFCYPDQINTYKALDKVLGPIKVFDNLYNIGNGANSVWAVTTSAGIIVIDTMNNSEETDDLILAGLTQLGLKTSDVKYLIISHGHTDHYGGAAEMQAKIPGLHVLMSPADWKLAQDTAANPNARVKTVAPKHDMDVSDGQKLTLGDETLTMYITPGHTQGTISMLVPVKDHGTPRLMVSLGGTGSNDLGPVMGKAMDESLTRLEKLAGDNKADGYISNHPVVDGAQYKLAYLKAHPDAPNPFVLGTAATQRFFNELRECHDYVAGEEALGKKMRGR